MNNPNKKEKLITNIMDAIDEVRIEIDKFNRGLGLDALPQLKFIESSLEEANRFLVLRNFAYTIRPKMNIARLVIDTWPLDSELRHKLCQIEHEYEHMKFS